MRVWGKWFALLLVSLMLVAAGCGSSPSKAPESSSKGTAPSSPSTSTPAASAPEAKLVPVTIAPGPVGGVLYLSEMVAEGLGSFKEQGIELTTLQTPGGNDATKALMSGEAEFAMLALDHTLKNRAQGADLVVVSFLTKDPGLIMIVQSDLKDQVKSIKDLKGKKIGVSSIGGGTHSTVLSLLKQAGMKESDVEVVAAKDKLGEMWDKKEIAAAVHVDPQIAEVVSKGQAWVLYDFRKPKDTIALYGTEYPLGTLVTRQDIIQNKPELVQKVVTAILNANKFISSHTPAEIAAKVPDSYKGANPGIYADMVKENLEGLALSGKVSQDSIQTVLRELQEKKAIPADAKIDLSQAINLSFIK